MFLGGLNLNTKIVINKIQLKYKLSLKHHMVQNCVSVTAAVLKYEPKPT